tara:strand:- start:688 stop:1356 length:669 start_codon:yes stop_codon:yes gene_type:complete
MDTLLICVSQDTNNEDSENFYIPDELWSIVKKYAGIYHHTTKWNQIMKIGVDKLHTYFIKNFKIRIVNAKTNPTETKKMILKSIIEAGMNEEKFKKLADIVDKKDIKKNNIDFSKYKVGDEVIYNDESRGYYSPFAGVITKVNKASITFKPYKISHKVSDNPSARFSENPAQVYENVNYYYDKTNFEKSKSVRTNFETKKTLGNIACLYKFEYRTQFIDHGL